MKPVYDNDNCIDYEFDVLFRIECTATGVPGCWIHYPRVSMQPIWDARAWKK